MELELGLKVTRTREDVSSSVDFRFSKDPFGPLVLSRETDSRFIIILHLKGFRKEGIEIDINEEGNRITIRGRKPVEEMVMVRWMAWRKEVELRTFKKVFRIPDFVDLDKIKARFDDDDATLTIAMPKRVMGITGFEIEEERVDFGDVSEIENREETEDDDNLEKVQEIDEKQQEDKMLEFAQEEETIGQQELTGPSREVREQDVMEKRVSQEKTELDGFGSRAFEEIEKQVPDELDRTSTSREIEKKMSDDDDGNGLSKVQGIEESKIQEVVEGERVEEEKKNGKLDTKNEDSEEEVDAKMGERLAPNVVENETKDEVDKIHEVVEEKEEDRGNAKVGIESEDISLVKLLETQEQHSKGQKRREKQERIEELEEEKTPEAETNIRKDVLKPVQGNDVPKVDTLAKIGDVGKEEIKNGDAEEEVVAENERKAEEFESGKLEADEVHKKERNENAKVGTQNEDIEEEQFQVLKQHDKQEKIKELVEEQAPKPEENIVNDIPEPVQEKHKNQAEECKEKVNDVGAKKVQESTRQKELDEPARREKESKIRELVESKTKDAEKETVEREIKEHDSYRPKILGEQEKIQELVEEKTDHSRNGKVKEEEEIAEKKTEIGDDDISRKVRGTKQNDSEAEEMVDAEIGKGFTPNIAETEKLKSDNIEPDKVNKMHELVEKKAEEEENAKVRRQGEDSSLIKRLLETEEEQFQEQKRHNKQENNQREENKERSVETEEKINDAGSRKNQEIREQEMDEPAKCKKEIKRNDAEKDDKGIAETETKEQESYKPKTLREQDKIQELAEEENKSFSKIGKIKEEEETAEKKKEHTAEMETKAALLESDKLDAEEEKEDAKAGTENEDIGLIKHQEIGDKQTVEAETTTSKDIPKPVHEIEMPEKENIEKLFQEETNNQRENYNDKAVDTDEKINGAGSRKIQDAIRQQDKDESERCEKKETAEAETKEQESYRPEMLREQEKIQELADEKSNFSRNEVKEDEEIAKKKQEFGDDDDDISNTEQRDPDAVKGQVERDKTQDLVLAEKVSDCSKETLADNDKSRKAQEIDEQQSHEEDTSIEGFSDAGMGEGFTPNIAETETKSEEFESDEVVEKEKEEEENAKVRRQSEDNSSIKKLQDTEEEQFQEQKLPDKQENDQQEEHKEKSVETGKRINDAGSRKVQEIRQHELYEPEKCEKESKRNDEEKEISETETKELEDEKIQELAAEENTEFSKVGEEKENAEKKTELSDDDMLTEVGDTEKRGPDAVKEQEEKYKFQESVPSEKVSDGGKGIITVAETLAESDKSRIVQEIDAKQSHEEDTSGKQFQKLAEVEDVESEKKTIEADKGIKDRTRAAQEIGRKGTTIQELEKQEMKDEADRPKKVTGTVEQELVNLDSQFEQDRTEEGDKTQESVEEETKDCKEEDKVSVESKTKTDDDDVSKVQGVKEQELYEPKEMVLGKTDDHEKEDEKEVAEPEMKAEFGGLSRVHGVEEQALQEPKIHKEPDKPRIFGKEEPNGQEKEDQERTIESQTITDVQNINEEGPDKPEPQEKQCKIQEVVGVGHDDCKEEEKEDREVMSKEELETEKDSSKKVQEIEKQNYDETKRFIVTEKKQETEEKEKTRAMEEKENVARRKKCRDSSLRKVRDDEDPELSKPRKIQEDKLREIVGSRTSDYREKSKTQDEDDILRSQEVGRPELDEFERHDEQTNIPQMVEEDKVESTAELTRNIEDGSASKFREFEEQKPYEDLTHEEREKKVDLVKEEETDPKDKHCGGEGHNDHKEEVLKKKVVAKAELRTEEDSSKKVQEIEEQELDELQGSTVQDKMQEEEEKEKSRAKEDEEVVEKRTKARDVSSRKVREDEDQESSKPPKIREEDMIQEAVEIGTSDYRETVKKQNEDEIMRSQETEIPDLDESERHSEQSNITKSVEDKQGEGRKRISELGEKMEGDSSGMFQKQKSYENWRQEESGNLVEKEATDTKDKHIGREGGHEKERYEQVAHTKTKVEDDIYKKVGDNEEQEGDKQKQNGQILREETSDFEKDEEQLVDESNEKIQETENEESHASDMDEKLDIFQAFVEDKTKDQENEKSEEVAAVVEMIEEQSKVLQTSDPEVKEEDEEMREQETQEMEMHRKQDIVQEFVEDEIREQGDENAEEAADVVKKPEAKSSREVQTIDEQELEEQNKILETSDPRVKEEGKERIAKKDADKEAPNTIKVREMKVKEEQHVQEDGDGEGSGGNEGRQGKTVESMPRERLKTKSNDDILRNTRETRVQDSDENKNQEPEGETEELERKETSKHEVKLVTEDDNLKKDQEFLEKESSGASKRRPVDHEQDMVEKGETETKADDGKSRKVEMSKMLDLDEAEENKELEKIRKPTGEKINAPEKVKEENEKIAEEEMQDMNGSKIQDQETKGQEPYKFLKSGEHDKIPEPIDKGTKCHREEEKGMEKRKFENMKRTAEDVSSRNVRETEAQVSDGLEKHRKLSEIQEDRDIKGSMEEKTQEHGDEKGRYKALPRTKSTKDSSQSQEKGSDQKQEKIQELMVDKEGKQEQKENTEKILQVEPKGSDDSSRKRETEEQELTRLREKRIRVKHQELVERETSNQSKEEKEDVGKPKREAEYDPSCKIRDNKEQNSDKLERHEAQAMTEDQELAGRRKEQEKKKASVKKDIANQSKKQEDQEETKSTDDSSTKIEKEKQESDEQKQNKEHDKNLGMVGEKRNDCRNQDAGKVDKDLADENNATAEAKTRSKDSESRKMGEIKEKETSEQSRLEEQEKNREPIFEDSISKKIQGLDKEESIKAEKRERIQEPVYTETSEDDSEELEVEVEDSEEDWEAEVIQDNDKIRLGFRLVGGSALFMSLIVIVIRIIRSKKTIKCYKF